MVPHQAVGLVLDVPHAPRRLNPVANAKKTVPLAPESQAPSVPPVVSHIPGGNRTDHTVYIMRALPGTAVAFPTTSARRYVQHGGKMSTLIRAALGILLAAATTACGIAGVSNVGASDGTDPRLELVSVRKGDHARIQRRRRKVCPLGRKLRRRGSTDRSQARQLRQHGVLQLRLLTGVRVGARHPAPRLPRTVHGVWPRPRLSPMQHGCWVDPSPERGYPKRSHTSESLFEVPRNVSNFELLFAHPLGMQLDVTDDEASPES